MFFLKNRMSLMKQEATDQAPHLSPYRSRGFDLPESPQTSERAQMARGLFPSTRGFRGTLSLGLGD